MTPVVKTFFCLFGAIGGGAMGFNDSRLNVNGRDGSWECLGSVDVDEAANRDFARLVKSRATTLDLMDREQYVAFHGHQPPAGWREATPADIRNAAQNRRPHCVFLSAPCKGFSGLLSQAKSLTDKYQALNRLTLRGVWLMLEAWADDPPELILFENVPRLASRGRALLDRITAMLRAYGYAVAETTHDCGKLGGLAESRNRFLLVARHIAKVPNLLYEPPQRALRAVGEVLSKMPLPGDLAAGPMHRVPQLSWKTWVRLAFVEAGKDWRSLQRLAVEDGHLRDYLIVPAMHHGGLGVRRWEESTGVVAGKSLPMNGAYSVADPRHMGAPKHSNEFRIVRWEREAGAITGAHGSGQCVGDPRALTGFGGKGKYRVTRYGETAGTVIARSDTGQGAFAVADPRPGMASDRAHYRTGGHYGVLRMSDTSGAVSAAACHDNGPWSVADHRLPAATDHLVAYIQAEDDTWHRPFTTLELAALQSLFDPEDPVEAAAFGLDGNSDQAWRERIGNAVPRASARAIADEMLRTLMLADAGETFALSNTPIWVRPYIAGLQLGESA